MSATTLRYHALTISFLPSRKEDRLSKGLRALRMRTSRRRVKQALRFMLGHISFPSY